MFEDRSKSKYDFNKMDKIARTKTQVLDQTEPKTDAHKKLFGKEEKTPIQDVKMSIKNEILKTHTTTDTSLDSLPSSAYLKSFENQIATLVEPEEQIQEEIEEEKKVDDFVSLIDTSQEEKINTSLIEKEIKKAEPKPKKNFSFRIKLVTGVYCILVALFGGWVIGNTINISQTNSYLYEATSKTSQINSNIVDILGDIAKLDSISSDPEDDTIVVKIATEEIEITPEKITEPNEYKKSSNWFDVICNWIAKLFGFK